MLGKFIAALMVASFLVAGDSAWCQTAPPTPAVSSADLNDYQLGVADQIQVTVFDEPTLSGTFLVNADGTVALPLVGNVHAAGLTTVQLSANITAALADGYLKHPNVAVSVLTFRPFYILGEVNKPGQYPYSPGLTVYKAVAMAGGYTYRADKHRIFIKDAKDDAEKRLPLTSGMTVEPGDTIRVAERFF